MKSKRGIILIGEPRINVLRSTSILNYLRKHRTNWNFTVITARRNRVILQANPAIDELLFIEDGATIAQMLNRTYDDMFSFDNKGGFGDLANLIQAENKFGIGKDYAGNPVVFKDGAEPLLAYASGDFQTIYDQGLSYQTILMRAAGIAGDTPAEMIFTLSQAASSFSEALLQEYRIDRSSRVTGIYLGVDPKTPTRCISQRNLSHFSEMILDSSGSRIILFAGYREKKFYKNSFNACAPGIIDGGCCKSFSSMAGILNICDLIIAQNSLALHLGLALGKKVILLENRESEKNTELYHRGRVVAETEGGISDDSRNVRYPEEKILSSVQELLSER